MSAAREMIQSVRTEVGKVVVGQDGVVTGLLTALLVGGHVLLEGVPGVAKTLTAKTLAAALDVQFSRVQFTPDLMPSDVTGQMTFSQSSGEFTFRPGPIFTNILLADEINRTPPKTQASLLEAMEERQVSIDGASRQLPNPFMVIATQNPVEYEGTYPLPEAQLDRFLFKLIVGYPAVDHETAMLTRHHNGFDPRDLVGAGVRAVTNDSVLAEARAEVGAMVVDDKIIDYLVSLVTATRTSPSLSLGVSPRGGAAMLHAAKAWAWLSNKSFVTPDEVKVIAKPVMRHRVALRSEAELEGVQVDGVIDGILAAVPVPR